MLEATNLTKSYGMRPVLRNVSLKVTRGEFVAVLGPNGAGKTTLLRVLATLVRPDSGKLMIDGVDTGANPQQARARVGMVSHQPLVYPDLTAAENLMFYTRMYGIGRIKHAEKSNADTAVNEKQIVHDALIRVDLLQRANDAVRTFSRGMLQRLSIARAVLHDPALLLLDEPYTGLDQTSAKKLNDLLRELAIAGRAVIMTTHEVHRGLEGATRAIVMKSGRITGELINGITPDTLGQMLG